MSLDTGSNYIPVPVFYLFNTYCLYTISSSDSESESIGDGIFIGFFTFGSLYFGSLFYGCFPFKTLSNFDYDAIIELFCRSFAFNLVFSDCISLSIVSFTYSSSDSMPVSS